MKISEDELICVEAKGIRLSHLYIYRASSLIAGVDELGKESGVLRAAGLWCEVETVRWAPASFKFRKSRCRRVGLNVDDWMVSWILAGVLIGERKERRHINSKGLTISPGRLADAGITESIWRHWIEWQAGEEKTVFANDCALKLKITPAAVTKQISLLGLSSRRVKA